MGVPPNGWFIMKTTIKVDDDWGYPYDSGNPQNSHITSSAPSPRSPPPRPSRVGAVVHVFGELRPPGGALATGADLAGGETMVVLSHDGSMYGIYMLTLRVY